MYDDGVGVVWCGVVNGVDCCGVCVYDVICVAYDGVGCCDVGVRIYVDCVVLMWHG